MQVGIGQLVCWLVWVVVCGLLPEQPLDDACTEAFPRLSVVVLRSSLSSPHSLCFGDSKRKTRETASDEAPENLCSPWHSDEARTRPR